MVDKVSIDNVIGQRVEHEDLLEEVVAPGREEVGAEGEGKTRPGEVGGHKDGLSGDTIEASILVMEGVHEVVAFFAMVVTVMTVVRVLRAVSEVLRSVDLLQAGCGSRESGLAEEEALEDIRRQDQRVLDGMDETILGANVGLDNSGIEVKVDSGKREETLASADTPVGAVVVGMGLAGVEPSSDTGVVGDALGVQHSVRADEVVESMGIDQVTNEFTATVLLVIVLVITTSGDRVVTLVVSDLLLDLGPLLNGSRTEGKILISFLLIVTTVVVPVERGEESKIVLLFENVLGGIGRVVEDVCELSELLRVVDDLPDGLVLRLKGGSGGSREVGKDAVEGGRELGGESEGQRFDGRGAGRVEGELLVISRSGGCACDAERDERRRDPHSELSGESVWWKARG